MSIHNIRKEVMLTLEKSMDSFMEKYLIPAEKIWQVQIAIKSFVSAVGHCGCNESLRAHHCGSNDSLQARIFL